MRNARVASLAAVLAGIAALTGCSGGSTTANSTSTAGAGTSSASPDPAVAWAGGVCSAADTLDASVKAIGGSLKIDLHSSSGAGDQVRTQLKTQIDAAETAAAGLATALTTVPAAASPDVTAAASQLKTSRDALGTSVDNLKSSISGLESASDAQALAMGLAAVGGQFAVTKAAATTFATHLKATSTAGSSAVKDAFGQAPPCQSRLSGATSTNS